MCFEHRTLCLKFLYLYVPAIIYQANTGHQNFSMAGIVGFDTPDEGAL
jgi:hypothetical protein